MGQGCFTGFLVEGVRLMAPLLTILHSMWCGMGIILMQGKQSTLYSYITQPSVVSLELYLLVRYGGFWFLPPHGAQWLTFCSDVGPFFGEGNFELPSTWFDYLRLHGTSSAALNRSLPGCLLEVGRTTRGALSSSAFFRILFMKNQMGDLPSMIAYIFPTLRASF